jgi:hypothetical protein
MTICDFCTETKAAKGLPVKISMYAVTQHETTLWRGDLCQQCRKILGREILATVGRILAKQQAGQVKW